MSRSHLRVSAQANNERYESNIVRELMNTRHPDYARSEATTITATPPERVKGKTIKQIELMNTIEALRKEIIDSMEARDAQVEALALQRESIAELNGQVATLKKLIDRRGDEHHREVRKGIVEIEALRALLKLYI